MFTQGISRRAGAALATTALLALSTATGAYAAGNKFTWSKNGNTAAAYWTSFKDDEAYMTVSGNARQRRGNRRMYVKVLFYSLRCSGGQNTCVSVTAGGVVTLGEGAEWHFTKIYRLPDMPRRRGGRFAASEPLDPDARMMQARIYICYDRNITPDPCSRPRYGNLQYTKAKDDG